MSYGAESYELFFLHKALKQPKENKRMNGRLSTTKEWKFVELVWKAYKNPWAFINVPTDFLCISYICLFRKSISTIFVCLY